MKKLLAGIILCSTFFLSCSDSDRQKEMHLHKDTASFTINKQSDPIANISYFKLDKDSVTVLPFEIAVSLNPKAKDRIIRSRETIMIDVSLTGIPKDTTLYSEDGQFYVASAEKEITYGQVARFDNIKFSRKIYDQLINKDLYVNAFVFSGRKSSPDNLLDCSIIADSVSNVVNKTLTITGKLIGDH
ncbi:MAG: hypothetical protein ABIY62_09920 [Ginsengibacter sp.]